MKRNRSTIISLILLVTLATGAAAQKQKKPIKPTIKSEQTRHDGEDDIQQDEKKVKDMVTFLGFVLNTLGSSTTSARDKDVLVTQSYTKIFRDSKVQVEDDLDEERSVVTNKDVVAYLKDINFFFKEVKFEFNIENIIRGTNADNQVFYKVSLHRTLKGTTSDGKTVNNITPRFIEINLNRNDQDLKIASIYTTELNEKEILQNWWKQLSFEWQSIFRKKFTLSDSVTIDDIRKVVLLEELDISNNKYIQDFEPLSQLKNLKVLNLSHTQIADLTPIRNLADLVELNVPYTAIYDLSPLKYATNLTRLTISNTSVNEIGVLQRMEHLQYLEMNSIKITDLTPIAGLTELVLLKLNDSGVSALTGVENLKQLAELNISKTGVRDLAPLKGLSNLKTLACDSTQVQDITALSSLDNLNTLRANHTLISDLQPLYKLAHLSRVYFDQTPVKKIAADALMAANPGAVVVYDSHDLKAWWDALSAPWQEVISNAAKITHDPSKEELAKIDNLDSINFSGNGRITDLEPLRKFLKLRIVMANKTAIRDLSPIREHREIKFLDISETNVTDLSALSQFAKLQSLKADRCKLQGIDPLQKLTALEKLYVDESGVNDINASEFLQANPTCLLIYKTVHLNHWWKNLSEGWKKIFIAQMKDTTRESLHKMVELETFHFEETVVGDLSGLSEFVRLRELHFSGTAITEITPIDNLKLLKSLQASNSPIQKIESISTLADLEYLDISNTPLEDLTPIWTLRKLKNLNCSGTQIKRLDAAEKIEGLESLDCSNTNVGKLTPLDYLHLKRLKCYNTRVSNRAIENFRASHPECAVVYYK